MPQSFDRVRETTDRLAELARRTAALKADVDAFAAYNAAQNITWTPATKNATIANATDIWTSTAHGFLVNQKVRLTNSGGALPAGFSANTDYFVIAANLAANTFQLSATLGGASVNATTDGTGTHTVNPVPDYITEDAVGNISGRNYDRTAVSNAIGALAAVATEIAASSRLAQLNLIANPVV